MFKVQEHHIGRFKTIRLLNSRSEEYVEVLTDFGAGINDLVIRNAHNELTSVIDGYQSEQQVINDHHAAFKGSKLSPFPNRIKAGNYKFGGQEYQLPINEVAGNNNLHGFLHNRVFQVIERIERTDSCVLILSYQNLGIDQGYPFTYNLNVTYQFSQKVLTIETEIVNTDHQDIPIGDGWHPYFAFSNVNEVILQMDKAKRVSSNFGNSLTDHHGFENQQIIGDTNLDDCFEINAEKFTLTLGDAKHGIDLKLTQQSANEQYKYLQIYTPPTRKSIAIEPVTCAPNAFNTGEGLIVLSSGQAIKMKFEIEI